ncbi:MAG: S-4TM family putative pore-forming effector, partial [Rhodanobacter sp.]|nr:S-4TM family putative pore-forming effector [Rhodanobacter sp.]
MNDIVTLQNSGEALMLLRARRHVLDRVKRAKGAYFITVLILPVVSVVAAAWWQEGKPWVSF